MKQEILKLSMLVLFAILIGAACNKDDIPEEFRKAEDYLGNYTGSGLALINTNDSPEGLVEVTATTSCCSENAKIYFEVWLADIGCDNGYFLLFNPNPATGETTLTIETDLAEKTFDAIAEWELEVYSETQLLKTKQTSLRGQSAKIQTVGWKEGVYMVRVNYNPDREPGELPCHDSYQRFFTIYSF